MNNELEQHKISDKIKWILTLLAFILVGVMLAGIICGWFDKKEQTPQEPEQTVTDDIDGSGLLVTPASTKTMKLAAAPLAQSVNDYILTATVAPSNAGNTGVDWAIAWSDASSEWASGKTVTDYITVAPASDGALTATVSCNKAFGEQIKVTVTSRENSKITADCLCDYSKKIIGFNITTYSGYNADGVNLSDNISIYTFDKPAYCFNYTSTVVTFEYSDYTVDDKFATTYNTTINPEYSGYLSEAGLTVQQTTKSSNSLWGGSHFFYFYASVPGGMREVSFCGFTPEQANTAISIAKQHTDVAAYNWSVICTGTYSTYTHAIPVYFSESSLTAVVTGVSLDNSSLMY